MSAERSPLPPLQATWIEALLPGATLPEERLATCTDCAMLCPSGEQGEQGLAGLGTYDPTIKCCTFLPELANFLVGRALRDEDPDAVEGRRTVEARIDAGAGVTPLGLGRSRGYDVLYRHQAPRPLTLDRTIVTVLP